MNWFPGKDRSTECNNQVQFRLPIQPAQNVSTVQTWPAAPARRDNADKRGVTRGPGGTGVLCKSSADAIPGSAKADETLVGELHSVKEPVSPVLPAVGTGVSAMVGV